MIVFSRGCMHACKYVSRIPVAVWMGSKIFLCLKSNYIFYKLNSLYTQDPLYNLGK